MNFGICLCVNSKLILESGCATETKIIPWEISALHKMFQEVSIPCQEIVWHDNTGKWHILFICTDYFNKTYRGNP